MTTLYRPVRIETAEQAEALPEGAIVISEGGDRYSRWSGTWEGVAGDMPSTLEVDLMCREEITALVPIEAEEETNVVVRSAGFQSIATHPYAEASMDSEGNVWFGDGLHKVDVTDEFNEWAEQHTRTRLVTPWEEA